jgi:hypothetical protein
MTFLGMWRTIIFRLLLETLTMLTNAHVVRGRPTLKDVERFWNGLVRELKEKSITTMNSINSMNTLSTNENTNEQTMYTALNTNSCIDENYYTETEYQNPDIQNSEADKWMYGKKSLEEKECRQVITRIKFIDSKVILMFLCIVCVLIIMYNYRYGIQNSILAFQQIIILFSSLCFTVLCKNYLCSSINIPQFMLSAEAVLNTFDDCDISEKAEHLCVILYDNKESIKDCRSRYAKFVYYNCVRYSCHVRRDREPSRIGILTKTTETCFTKKQKNE